MQLKFLKILFLVIIFSNHIFAKDFDDLFSVTIKIQDESVDKSIDNSFESLVFRLIGSKDYKKMKIIKGDYSSKDFLKTYSFITQDNEKLLKASFDEETVINQFIENDISFVGRNRPVVFLDVQIDNGFDKPFQVESIPYENSLESSIQDIFTEISQQRGIFYEFPQNNINLQEDTYFFDQQINSGFEEYKFDYYVSFAILRSELNRWSMSYENQTLFFNNTNEIIKAINEIFNEKSSEYLSNFVLNSFEQEVIMKINKVSSAEKVDKLFDILDKMISIKNYNIKSFEKDEILLFLEVFGTEDQFIESVKTHKNFLLQKSAKVAIFASLNDI